jgi:hypothetical protein
MPPVNDRIEIALIPLQCEDFDPQINRGVAKNQSGNENGRRGFLKATTILNMATVLMSACLSVWTYSHPDLVPDGTTLQ